MCGRYMIISSPEAIRRLFGYPEQPNFPPRYNMAPTQPVPIVRLVDGKRQFALVRWGLIPAWVKDPQRFSLLINARGEIGATTSRPSATPCAGGAACSRPTAFTNGRTKAGASGPILRPQDGEPIAFAGLWETWMGPNGEEMETAAIVTTPANGELARAARAHAGDRAARSFRSVAQLQRASMPSPRPRADCAAAGGLLEAYEVSPAVNRTANDGPELMSRPAARAGTVSAQRVPSACPRERGRKKDERQPSLF